MGRILSSSVAAELLGDALRNAKIDIVGGDGQFLDRVVNSVGMGKSIDAFLAESETAKAVMARLGVAAPAATVVKPSVTARTASGGRCCRTAPTARR